MITVVQVALVGYVFYSVLGAPILAAFRGDDAGRRVVR